MPVQTYAYNTVGGLPWGNERLQAYGSPFLETPGQAPTALNAEATIHLQRFIFREIMGTDPEPYFAALKLFMFNDRPDTADDDIYTWIEKPSQRYAPTASNGVAAPGVQLQAAVPGVVGDYVEYNIPVASSDIQYLPIDNDIMFKGGAFGTIVAHNTGTSPMTVTVRSHVSAGLPEVLQGDRLPLMGEIRADGMERIANVQRMGTIERSNYVATFMRSIKWGRKEQLKWMNNAATNYRDENQKELILNLKYDALVNFWAGRKEMRRLSGGEYAKGMDGIYPQMLAGGSASSTTTLGNLVPTFEAMGHNTNYQAKGGVRYVFGRTELLTILSKEYKDLRTRYAPNSYIADMDLEAIKFGGQKYVLVPVEPFGDINYFQSDWADRLFVIDTSCIKTVVQKGLPMMDIQGALQNHLQSFRDNPRELRDYKIWSAEINISLKMKEPRGSYVIEVI